MIIIVIENVLTVNNVELSEKRKEWKGARKKWEGQERSDTL